MKLSARSLIILSPLMLLGACGGHHKKAADQTAQTAADATGNAAAGGAAGNAVGHAAAAVTSIAYDCLPAHRLSASYDNSGTTPTAKLTLDGKSYTLTSVVAASGSKYSTSQGRTPGKTLIWWTKGSDGTLYEGKAGDATGSSEKQIASCSPSKS